MTNPDMVGDQPSAPVRASGDPLTRRQAPIKRIRLDPEANSGRPERIDLGLDEEVARIDQAEAIGLTSPFVGRRAAQGQERVVLGAGHPVGARRGLLRQSALGFQG